MKNKARITLSSVAALAFAIAFVIGVQRALSTSIASESAYPRAAYHNSDNSIIAGPRPLPPGDDLSGIFDERGSLTHALEYLNRAALLSPAFPQ